MKKLIVAFVVAAFVVAPLTQAGEGCCKDKTASEAKAAGCPAQASCSASKDATAKAQCPAKQKATAKKVRTTAKGGQLASSK
jgi:hypothetical protein